jgi:DNA-binding beta-propeller fold protein YncE
LRIRTKLVALIIGLFVVGAPAASGGQVPGAKTLKACRGAGPFWPTMTLALRTSSAWVACKEQLRVIRLNTKTGRISATVRTRAPVIAVATGYGSVWALDSNSTLYRIKPSTARVNKRAALPAAAAYNLWIGGGAVWVAADQGAEVLRISPATGRVEARIPVGDGPASIAFAGTNAWVINHRDRRLQRIDLATNAVSELLPVPGGAPERIAWLAESLWVTGRGTDLLQLDPQTGKVKATIEIGAGGIDVVAGAGSLWVPVRSEAVDPTGFPTMESLQRVSPATGAVTTVTTATGRVDVHGLRAYGGFLWIADNRSGLLYRLKM